MASPENIAVFGTLARYVGVAAVKGQALDGRHRAPLETEEPSYKAYKKLRLPSVLRKMPDFIVASAGMETVRLVEVKFRTAWTGYTRQDIWKAMQRQVKEWGPLLLIIVFREFCNEGTVIKCAELQANDQNYLEIVLPEGVKNWNLAEPSDLRPLSDFFPDVSTETDEFRRALGAMLSSAVLEDTKANYRE